MAALSRYGPWWVLVGLISLALQIGVPIAGDEAYFVSWGRDLQAGFYDHPPMPGWISFVLWRLGEVLGLASQGALHRGFALLSGLGSLWLVSWRIRQMPGHDRGHDRGRDPAGAVLLLALAPGFLLLFNLFLNDTILAVATLVFVIATERAFRGGRAAWVVVAGLALAAMLLTKYTGAVVYLGLLLGLLGWPAAWRFLFGRMVVISFIALGPFLWHLWWNLNNCDVNLAFNFVFRVDRAAGWGPAWLALTLVVIGGLPAVAALWTLSRNLLAGRMPDFFGRLFAGTLVVMLLIALWRHDFGVNWGAPLGFLAVLALAEAWSGQSWRRLVGAAALFGGVTLVPVGLLALGLRFMWIAPEDIVSDQQARWVRFHYDLDEGRLDAQLRALARGRVVAALDYGTGAMLVNRGFPAVVLSRSVYGRNADLRVDFSALAGKDFLIVGPRVAAEVGQLSRLFQRTATVQLAANRGTFPALEGWGFRYETYLNDWIRPVISMYYDKTFLPVRACYMDRYRNRTGSVPALPRAEATRPGG